MKIKTLIIALLLVLGTTAFAQRTTKSVITNYNLTVNVNVGSYSIMIDNQMVKGRQFSLPGGNHNIAIRARGFQDWRGTINLNRNQQLNVSMIPNQFVLTVQTNTNSSIYINGKMVANNSFNQQLSPGTYSIIIRANGYLDYRATINLDRDTNILASLQPMVATVNIFVSQDILNRNMKGATNQIRVYDNGILVNGFNFNAPPGSHTIRIETGGLAVEGFYQFEAGQTYTIEPTFYLNLKQ